jgi:hypothetical protein
MAAPSGGISIIVQGNTPITANISAKTTISEKESLVAYEINTNLSKVKFPLTFSPDKNTSITIKKIAYDTDYALNGYYISATRDGKDIAVHSPIWVHNQNFLVEVSRTSNLDTNVATSVTVTEDPLGAVENTLYQYVRTKPLGPPEGDDVLFVYATHTSDLVAIPSSATYATIRAASGDLQGNDTNYNAVY